MSVTDFIKCVVVGDGTVGKTALIISYVNGTFPVDYLPTVCDNFQKNVSVDSQIYNLSLWDTAGQEGYARLRTLSYPDTDVFLACFSTVSPVSFHNIREKWNEELKHFAPNVPKLLVGTKVDLRKEGASDVVSREMGEGMNYNMGMQGYAECSAKENQGMNELFEMVVRTHLKHKHEQLQQKQATHKSKCIIL